MVNLAQNKPIVQSETPIALFGGGETDPRDLNLVLNRVGSCVAADGGAAVLLDSGHIPDAVIGDFDSLNAADRQRIPADRLHPIAEQDSTDFDKALRHVDAPLVLGVGFLGARVDHQLAVLNTLVQRPERACVLIGRHEVVFHLPPEFHLDLERGATVSLFPLRRICVRGQGLEWPLHDLVLEPGGRIGTSNRAVSDISLQVDGPGLLMMVPRAALDQVMRAFLSDQTGRWPARAK